MPNYRCPRHAARSRPAPTLQQWSSPCLHHIESVGEKELDRSALPAAKDAQLVVDRLREVAGDGDAAGAGGHQASRHIRGFGVQVYATTLKLDGITRAAMHAYACSAFTILSVRLTDPGPGSEPHGSSSRLFRRAIAETVQGVHESCQSPSGSPPGIVKLASVGDTGSVKS